MGLLERVGGKSRSFAYSVDCMCALMPGERVCCWFYLHQTTHHEGGEVGEFDLKREEGEQRHHAV